MTPYVYLHCSPDGIPFYVGKGVGERYKLSKTRNQHHKNKVAKIGRDNVLIGKIECSTNENSLSLEVGIIACLKRMGIKLTNLTNGGEGTVGRVVSDETKLKMSNSSKGIVFSEEHCKRIAMARVGVKLSETHKLKISESNKGRKMSANTKAALLKSNFERVYSEDTKRKIGDANRGRIVSAETRIKIGNINRGKKRPYHSILLKEKGLWKGDRNYFYGSGERQIGSKNHMARKVKGIDNNGTCKMWDTLKEASEDLGVSIQSVCQALKKQYKSKGWKLEYVE